MLIQDGTLLFRHPDREVTDAVLFGLAHNVETRGRPLCPCRFYPDASAEVKQGKWVCPCDDMRTYKYCHCLLFTGEPGLPITEGSGDASFEGSLLTFNPASLD